MALDLFERGVTVPGAFLEGVTLGQARVSVVGGRASTAALEAGQRAFESGYQDSWTKKDGSTPEGVAWLFGES